MVHSIAVALASVAMTREAPVENWIIIPTPVGKFPTCEDSRGFIRVAAVVGTVCRVNLDDVFCVHVKARN
jgi:hypothetical protein